MKREVLIIINEKEYVETGYLTDLLVNRYGLDKVSYISSDKPTCIVANAAGCMDEEVDEKSIEFRRKLKELIDWYNGASLTYCFDSYDAFHKSEEKILVIKASSDDDFSHLCKYFRLKLSFNQDCVLMCDIENAEKFDRDTFLKDIYTNVSKLLLC